MQYKDLKDELVTISKVIEQYPENLKSKVFEILLDNYINGDIKFISEDLKSLKTKSSATESSDTEHKKSSARKTAKESYTIDRVLNLRGDDKIISFKSFFEQKKPSSKGDFNALSIYYLSKIIGLEKVTLNQVFTCYAEVKFKPAENFKQSFIDVKNKFGYIEYDKDWNLNIPHRGIVFIEHDLPKTKSKK